MYNLRIWILHACLVYLSWIGNTCILFRSCTYIEHVLYKSCSNNDIVYILKKSCTVRVYFHSRIQFADADHHPISPNCSTVHRFTTPQLAGTRVVQTLLCIVCMLWSKSVNQLFNRTFYPSYLSVFGEDEFLIWSVDILLKVQHMGVTTLHSVL